MIGNRYTQHIGYVKDLSLFGKDDHTVARKLRNPSYVPEINPQGIMHIAKKNGKVSYPVGQPMERQKPTLVSQLHNLNPHLK